MESEFIFPNGKEKMKRNRDEDEFSPLTINSEASESFVDHSSVDHHTVFSTMLEDTKEIEEGDLSSLEKRLVGQITTLDTIFTNLAVKAASLIEYEGFQAAEKCLNLALKAQGKSANAIKILAEIKQPKHLTIAKQANIANQQVVNNGVLNSGAPEDASREKKIVAVEKNENELIQTQEYTDAKMDTRIKKKTR